MNVRKISVATCLLVLLSTASACGQPKSTHMLPEYSIKNSTPESSTQMGFNACREGSISVTYGSLYQEGKINIQPYDLAKLPALPDGYEVFGGTACSITTTAVIGPPQIVRFKVNSVTDETTFRRLRIFHAEPDIFDPESPMWFDRTILPPQKPAPDFNSRTLGANSDELGVFVIGRLMREVPKGLADLSVQCSASADRVRAPNSVTYTCKVTNNGPQAATEVGLINSISPDATLISYSSLQGSCKEKAGSLYCKLGTLAVGAFATLEIEIKPYEGTGSFPTEGKESANVAWVAAKEDDNNQENDRATQTTLMLPDPNMPPVISIENPKHGDYFVGPTTIKLQALAYDTDGTVEKVEFFDNGKPIGVGIRQDQSYFALSTTDLGFGNHTLLAVATDNQNRKNFSVLVDIIVNGRASVQMINPREGASLSPRAKVTLLAKATDASGPLQKVEFFANGMSLGQGIHEGRNRYSLRLNSLKTGIYAIVAVATDVSGVTTTSIPVRFKVRP